MKMTNTAEKMHIASIAPETPNTSAASGSAEAALIEPRETFFVRLTMKKKTAIMMQNTSGWVISPMAAPTETPFPPRNSKYTGKQ